MQEKIQISLLLLKDYFYYLFKADMKNKIVKIVRN